MSDQGLGVEFGFPAGTVKKEVKTSRRFNRENSKTTSTPPTTSQEPVQIRSNAVKKNITSIPTLNDSVVLTSCKFPNDFVQNFL